MDARGLRARSQLSWVHTGHGIPSAGCACCLALRPPALAVFRGFLPLTAALVGASCSLPWSNPGSTFTLSYLPGVHTRGSLSSGNSLPGGHTCMAAADHWRDPGAESKPGPASRGESALWARGQVSSPPRTGALPSIHSTGRPGRQGPRQQPTSRAEDQPPRPWIRESTPPCRVVGTAPSSPQVGADGVLGPLTNGTPQPAPRRHRGPAHPGHRGETCRDRQPPGAARGGGSSPGAPLVTQPRGQQPMWGPWPPLSHPTETGLHPEWPEASRWHRGPWGGGGVGTTVGGGGGLRGVGGGWWVGEYHRGAWEVRGGGRGPEVDGGARSAGSLEACGPCGHVPRLLRGPRAGAQLAAQGPAGSPEERPPESPQIRPAASQGSCLISFSC